MKTFKKHYKPLIDHIVLSAAFSVFTGWISHVSKGCHTGATCM